MSAGINQILSGGPGEIIIGDFLGCASQLPCASKAMKALVENTAGRLRAELELRDKPSLQAAHTEAENICEDRPLETVLAEHMKEVGRLISPLQGGCVCDFGYQLALLLDRILAMRTSYVEAAPEARDRAFSERLLLCLHKIRERADLIEQARGIPVAGIPLRPESAEETALLDAVRLFLAQENLAKRAQAMLAAQNNQQPRERLAAFLSDLRKGQDDFRLTQSLKQEFECEAQKPERFSYRGWLAREIIGVRGQCSEDVVLRLLWRHVRQQLNLNNAPADGAPIFQIRNWINRPEHAQALAGHLDPIEPVEWSIVPPEMGKFKGITHLFFRQEQPPAPDPHRLIALPDEFGELDNLETLVFFNTTSFREIPRVLEDLPALRILDIEGNTRPIRIFPSWLDNKINGFSGRNIAVWFLNELIVNSACLDRLLGLRILRRFIRDEQIIWNARYAGLPHEEFTDIPFTLWFKETFFIPWATGYIAASLFEFVDNVRHIREIYQEGWRETVRSFTLPLLPLTIFAGFLELGTLFLTPFPILWWTGFMALHFAPLLNLLIHNTIGRIAEACYVVYQEEMGAEDPRMIHIRDFPAPQARALPAAQ